MPAFFYSRRKTLLLAAVCAAALFAANCSQDAQTPSPTPKRQTAKQQATNSKAEEPLTRKTESASPMPAEEIAKGQKERKSPESAADKTTDGPSKEQADSNPVRAGLAQEEQNAGSMIESKLFASVEEAYRRRDQELFLSLYRFYLESFPKTKRKPHLDRYLHNFFYAERLEVARLRGALVEIEYPKAQSWRDLSRYFADLSNMGIETVQIGAVQQMGTPLFLFADSRLAQGYYFSAADRPVIDDILSGIAELAHDNRLKIFASLPLRHHPLIGHNSLFVADETWSSVQRQTNPNSKLDLLNPDSQTFLEDIVDAILSSPIDGLVLQDDFTYRIAEGFSAIAQKRFKTETGRNIRFAELFVPVESRRDSSIEVVAADDFRDVVTWRTRQIKQLLWELIARIRERRADFIVGIEVTPEMIVQEEIALKWYSTSLRYLRDLDVDFFRLNWKKHGSEVESDRTAYRQALALLRDAIDRRTEVYAEVPLGEKTKNVILLNRRIGDIAKLQSEYENVKIAVGTVNRLNRLDIVDLYEE